MGQGVSDALALPTTIANNVSSNINTGLNGITSNINNGINVVKDAEGNFFSVIKDTSQGVISAYKHTVTGLQLAYQDTEENFFKVVNNIQQNVANSVTLFQQNIRMGEKDIMTVLDYAVQDVSDGYKLTMYYIFNTIQYIVALGSLGFLLVFILYGKEIVEMIQQILKNGIKLSF